MSRHRRLVGRALRRHQQGRRIHSPAVAFSYLTESETTRPLMKQAFTPMFEQVRQLLAIFRQYDQPRKQLLMNGRKPR
ncbi:MAG: hypothetical protein ACTH6A_06655 [Brachybacterium tyrofermentans]|uniref:hypothetical protein n=1 Tax=Brachybacterium tyrofermentans TaxID=47848 RepID=UPI003F921F2F